MSNVSPVKTAPFASSSARASIALRVGDVGAGELLPDLRRVEEVDAHVLAELELRPRRNADLLQPEGVAVEAGRAIEVGHRHRDEVRALDDQSISQLFEVGSGGCKNYTVAAGRPGFDQPTLPSIWSWISRFISTAYSIGSSLISGSMKPLTIIVLASASDRPRLVR